MNSKQEILLEVIKLYQKKYNHMSELLRLTTEMSDVLGRNDTVSAQLMIQMRQDELEQIRRCNRNVIVIQEAVSIEMRNRIGILLKDAEKEIETEGFEEHKLRELFLYSAQLKSRIIEIDKRISQKMAGEDSYYNKEYR